MCFANAVLQTLVYCAPFHRLLAELGRLLPAALAGESGVSAPLVDATIEFLREFGGGRERERGMGSVKGKERAGGRGEEEREEEERTDDAFVPTCVYDALKEKKRFDHMRVSFFLFSFGLRSTLMRRVVGRADIRRMQKSSLGSIWTRSRRSCCRY